MVKNLITSDQALLMTIPLMLNHLAVGFAVSGLRMLTSITGSSLKRMYHVTASSEKVLDHSITVPQRLLLTLGL